MNEFEEVLIDKSLDRLHRRLIAMTSERDLLREALIRLVGASDRVDLEQMILVLRAVPAPSEDGAAMINAIEVLLRVPAR